MRELLTVSDLSLEFRPFGKSASRKVLNEVNVSVSPGEIYGLVGESGSGKSMTAYAIMRLLPHNAKITSGNIKFLDHDLLRINEKEMCALRGKSVSMIFQEPMSALNPVMKIGLQLMEAFYTSSRDTKSFLRANIPVFDKAVELLDSVGIPDSKTRMDWYPHQLSGGQRQRVIIAIALAGNPDLLIADEPTTALDAMTEFQILELLRKIRNERNIGILLVTHDLGVINKIADRVGVMQNGTIIEESITSQFFLTPKQEYSKLLLKSLPSKSFLSENVAPAYPSFFKYEKTEPLLRVENIKVSFPIRKGIFGRKIGEVLAVDTVTLSIQEGKTLAVLGESGSGKTTLGRAILRLIDSASGRVFFKGENLFELTREEMRQRRKDLQIIFQDPFSSLNPRMRVYQIISEGMNALGITDAEDRTGSNTDKIEYLLSQVGLSSDYKMKFPHELSGGQRQRVAIARALAVEPRLIICDEPTSALDMTIRSQIIALLRRLQTQLGLSYLLITHDLSLIPSFAHDVLVMKAGKVVEFGSTKDVLTAPKHEYTQNLISLRHF